MTHMWAATVKRRFDINIETLLLILTPWQPSTWRDRRGLATHPTT